ncbi:MAG: CPBP family intramembrane metalloprotease [Clostridia bacterium]|nr:CPBP family intramembrane metalloprotease [Clostridia bacterium]
MYQEPERTTNEPLPYSRIGVALTLMILVNLASQLLLLAILQATGRDVSALTDASGSTTLMWLAALVPQYALGFPAALLLMRSMPARSPSVHTPDRLDVFKTLFVCSAVMFLGSLIGNLVSSLLSSGTSVNPLDAWAEDTNPIKIPIMVLMGPLLEELLFRKTLIDRTLPYGEKAAVVFSALCFGLFHMNVYQFFYAFGLGLLLGYIYVRTGRLRYTILIHMLINLMGAVVAPALIARMDLELLESVNLFTSLRTVARILVNSLPYLLYATFLLSSATVGLILLFLNRRRITFEPQPAEPRGSSFAQYALMNPGMIVFMAICVLVTLWTLFR